MRHLGLAFVLASLLFGLAPAQPSRAESCRFVLGFATLASLIPEQVGQCLENERNDPATGDSLQATTGGLLVWRKLDNHTAFTDGTRTWVNGPLGLQERLNNQRFAWEISSRSTVSTTPPPVERCHTAGLSITLEGTDVGAGNFVGTFYLRNAESAPCTLYGFPGARLLDAAGDPLPTDVVRNGGYFAGGPEPSTVLTVPPGGKALFRMHWEQVPVGSETTCPTASAVAVTPPDETVPLVVPARITACGGGRLDVTPVLPTGS